VSTNVPLLPLPSAVPLCWGMTSPINAPASQIASAMIFGYFLLNHRKNAGTPIACACVYAFTLRERGRRALPFVFPFCVCLCLCGKERKMSRDVASVAAALMAKGRPVLASEVVGSGEALTGEELRQLEEAHGIKSRDVEQDPDGGVVELAWATETQVREQIAAAEERLGKLDARKAELERQVAAQLDRIHRFNETRDIAQGLMGKLAEWERTTVQDMHVRYGVANLGE
jgi:hypothetical protein